MATKIKEDYQPSQRVYELLKTHGILNPVEFVGHEMGAFFLYWEGTGKIKENWDSTCLNWMKRVWEDKRHNRAYSKPGDPFANALQVVTGSEKKRYKGTYAKPPRPPKPQERMVKEKRLEFADSFDNKVALADAYFNSGETKNAIELYEKCLN